MRISFQGIRWSPFFGALGGEGDEFFERQNPVRFEEIYAVRSASRANARFGTAWQQRHTRQEDSRSEGRENALKRPTEKPAAESQENSICNLQDRRTYATRGGKERHGAGSMETMASSPIPQRKRRGQQWAKNESLSLSVALHSLPGASCLSKERNTTGFQPKVTMNGRRNRFTQVCPTSFTIRRDLTIRQTSRQP